MTQPETAAASRDGETNVVAFLKLVWSQRYLFATVVFLCTLAAVVLALIATPMFRAEVVVSEVHDDSLGGGKGLMGQLGGLASLAGVSIGAAGADDHNAQAVLGSRHLVEEFITRNKLLPELFKSGSRLPPTLWNGVNKFKDKLLDIRDDKLKGTTTVTVDWTDPVTAARWANGLVSLTNELIRTKALEESRRNIAYLGAQAAKTNVVELQKVLYDLIESQTKIEMLANARVEYALTVIDPAVPPEIRHSPRRTLMVIGGFAIGLVIGAAVVAFRNIWRRDVAS